MSAATVEIEVYVVIGADGQYSVGCDIDLAKEQYESDIEEISQAEAIRIVRCVLSVPLPQITTLRGIVPADTTEGSLLAS